MTEWPWGEWVWLMWCLTTKRLGLKSEGVMDWTPGVATTIASMDPLLWKDVTRLDPEDLSYPLSRQDRRQTWLLTGCSAFGKTQLDWNEPEIFFVWGLSFYFRWRRCTLSSLPFASVLLDILRLLQMVQSSDRSAESVNMCQSQSEVAAWSSSPHQTAAMTSPDRRKTAHQLSFPLSLSKRGDEFPRWEYHQTERQVLYVTASFTRIHNVAVWDLLMPL